MTTEEEHAYKVAKEVMEEVIAHLMSEESLLLGARAIMDDNPHAEMLGLWHIPECRARYVAQTKAALQAVLGLAA